MKVREDEPWSAYEICEAYAEKRGYHTTKGRTDTHRAGLEILQDHCDGRYVLYSLPNSTRVNYRLYGVEKQETDEVDEQLEELASSRDIVGSNTRKRNNRRKKKKQRQQESDEDDGSDDGVSGTATNSFAALALREDED